MSSPDNNSIDAVEKPKSLTRTLSETLFGGFRRNKRSRDDIDDNESSDLKSTASISDAESRSNSTNIEGNHKTKKQKKLSKEEEEKELEKLKIFQKQEEYYDSLLKPEYRKWRPKGYKLNCPPEDRPIRIYADGVFDLFHLGHMRQLEQCKKAFPNVELVVGIPNDKETHKRKGLTVLTDKQRYETVRHCKWVDEVIEDAPWILDMKFLKNHKIDYCAHDDLPYVADGIDDIYKPMKEAGMFIATQRTNGISTSDIITKIIRDYDKYLMRNFDRGATRQELNVSWLKKNELDMKKHINEFKNSWKQTNDNLSHITKDLYVLVRESLINSNNLNKNNNKLLKGLSPVDKFALKFNANGLKKSNSGRNIFNNIRDWVGNTLNSEVEDSNNETETDADTTVNLSVKPNTFSTPSKRVIKVPKKINGTPKSMNSPKRTPKKTPKKQKKLN